MRNIGIIGAGQAGLQLGFMLLAKGYSVTVYSDRSAEQIFNARLSATAAQFGRPSSYERELGIDFWNPGGHVLAGGDLDVCPAPGQRAISVRGRISTPGFAVDGRAKYARWLAEFGRRGGTANTSRCLTTTAFAGLFTACCSRRSPAAAWTASRA